MSCSVRLVQFYQWLTIRPITWRCWVHYGGNISGNKQSEFPPGFSSRHHSERINQPDYS